jgi:aminoglycoside 6'-N-acetyltransferase
MYEFRPMTTDDLPLVKRWLAMPHVTPWWGDANEQLELVSGDLSHPAMDQFIVASDGRPFGYLQCYDLTAWNSGFGPQPLGTRGIDQFSASRTWSIAAMAPRSSAPLPAACWRLERRAW